MLEADDRLRMGDSAYFHYSMKPIGQVSATDTEYVTLEYDSNAVYTVTSIDSTGYESDMSAAILQGFWETSTPTLIH